jgi:hypothetical protein
MVWSGRNKARKEGVFTGGDFEGVMKKIVTDKRFARVLAGRMNEWNAKFEKYHQEVVREILFRNPLILSQDEVS